MALRHWSRCGQHRAEAFGARKMELEQCSAEGGTWISTIDRMIRADDFPVWRRARGEGDDEVQWIGRIGGIRRHRGCPAGKIVNGVAYSIALFEATETRKFRREFECSTDEHLEWCEDDGVEPGKPFPNQLRVSLCSEFHASVVTAAMAERVGINSWTVRVRREAVVPLWGNPVRSRPPAPPGLGNGMRDCS